MDEVVKDYCTYAGCFVAGNVVVTLVMGQTNFFPAIFATIGFALVGWVLYPRLKALSK